MYCIFVLTLQAVNWSGRIVTASSLRELGHPVQIWVILYVCVFTACVWTEKELKKRVAQKRSMCRKGIKILSLYRPQTWFTSQLCKYHLKFCSFKVG